MTNVPTLQPEKAAGSHGFEPLQNWERLFHKSEYAVFINHKRFPLILKLEEEERLYFCPAQGHIRLSTRELEYVWKARPASHTPHAKPEVGKDYTRLDGGGIQHVLALHGMVAASANGSYWIPRSEDGAETIEVANHWDLYVPSDPLPKTKEVH